MQPIRNQEIKFQDILDVINKRCGSDGKRKYYILSVYPPDAITQLPRYELSAGFSCKWMALIVYYISKIWKTTVWDSDIERTVKTSLKKPIALRIPTEKRSIPSVKAQIVRRKSGEETQIKVDPPPSASADQPPHFSPSPSSLVSSSLSVSTLDLSSESSNSSSNPSILDSPSKIDPIKVKTDQALLVDPNPELTQAREEFLTWFSKGDSVLGEGEYDTLIAKVNTLSKHLPKKEITFHCDYFRFGYPLYYVEKTGQEKYIPIKRMEGIILDWQLTTLLTHVSWPLKDPQDNSYFIPEITVNIVKGSHSGSESVGAYLYGLLQSASNKTSSSCRILERLTGYAEDIQKEFGNSRYKRLREMIPSYPALPDLPR